MNYTTILVFVDNIGESIERIRFANDMATDLDAFVVGIAARQIHPMAAADGEFGADAMIYPELLAQNQARLKELKDQFLGIVNEQQNASWRQFEQTPTDAVLSSAGEADLIICGTPHGPSPLDIHTQLDTGAVLCGAGRPILIPGPKASYHRPKTVLVGWKETTQARRALLDSLPFLKQASEVAVVTIAQSESERAENSLAGVVRYLMRHGIAAHSEFVHEEDNSGMRFLEIAAQKDVDLVVTGAYGRGRLREWIFGGFTRTLLFDDRFPRFMSG